jgi:hypothetical protein
MRNWLLGRLRIHIWGGLGSQLFALATALDLRLDSKNKDIILVLHNGGVTLRDSEINALAYDFKTEMVSDFKGTIQIPVSARKKSVRSIASTIFQQLGLIETLDSRKYPSIWAVSLRGHYTYRKINEAALAELIQRMRKTLPRFGESARKNNAVGIQYRLGDLEFLSTKHFVDPNRILRVLERLTGQEICVYSDSPNSAREKLNLPDSLFLDLSALETISELVGYEEFIGTNSKISQWVILFRLYLASDAKCWLPIEFKDQFYRSLPESITPTNLFFY